MVRPGIRKSLEVMQALCVSVIFAEHSFRDNPRNTQCSNAAAIDCMPSLLLQQDTIYGRVKDEGGSLGRRVVNSPFLNARACSVSIYKDSIKAFLSLSTGCCFRAKNASVLYPSANDSAPTFSSTPVG